MIWKILGIEKTKDETIIKDAYRKKLRFVNPEDDAEGFKELRSAYDEAMVYASLSDEEEEMQQIPQFHSGKKTEVDMWIDRVEAVYKDVAKRINEDLWKEILQDPVCDDLDTELEAAEKLLVFFMSHSHMPQVIWQMVEQRFHYKESYNQLKERFPENYLEYIFWQIRHKEFLDYSLFEGKLDSKVDEYINSFYDLRNQINAGDYEAAKKELVKLNRYDISHPYAKVDEARILLAENSIQKALTIMEDLDFEYSDSTYIERNYADVLFADGQIAKAKKVYQDILENMPEDYYASIGRAKCVYAEGEYEKAKEYVEDVLENRVQDPESMQLLQDINDKLVTGYKEQWENSKDREIGFKLGWCYYQQREFAKGIELLDSMCEDMEEYDYINLRCRLYLAAEEYEKAYPLTRIWLALIEKSPDDGTKEMNKRKNRLSLAYFSIGICEFEHLLAEKREQDNKEITHNESDAYEKEFQNAESFIHKAISIEENTMVRLSYMEQMAKYYLAREQYEKCITICNDILSVDRGFYPAYVHRQRANYELKNAKEVVDDYFACKEIYAGYSVPYVLAAEVFMAFEQYEDVESILADAKQVELESDGLELFQIKCIHYKEFSNENVREAYSRLEKLVNKVENYENRDNCDIENIAELYREQVILLWDLDLTQKALEAVEEAILKVENANDLRYLKVDILSREKRFEEAEKECRRLLTFDAMNLTYRMKMGNILEHMDRTQEAIKVYMAILSDNKKHVPAIRRLMYIYSYLSNQHNNLDWCRKGIDYATQLIELTQTAEGYVERGNLYIDVYELEKAAKDCKEAIMLDSEAYYAYNNLGCALLKLRRIDEAIEPLLKVIEMDPEKDYLPYLNLADCYRLKNQYALAIQAYEKVIELKRKRGLSVESAEDDIANLYCLGGNYEKAAQMYKEKIRQIEKETGLFSKIQNGELSLKNRITNEQVHQLIKYQGELADIYRQMNKHKEAVALFKKIEKLFYKRGKYSDCSEIEDIAEYYRDRGELDQAMMVMDRLLDKERSVGKVRRESLNILATIEYERGNFENAKECAKQWFVMFLDHFGGEDKALLDKRYKPARLFSLSLMSVMAGEIKEARQYIEQIRNCNLCVVCEDCDCFEYYYGLGMIYATEKNYEDAEKCFRKALKILPDYPECKYQLQKLKNAKGQGEGHD